MKIKALFLLVFINIYANENWIPISQINETQTPKQNNSPDINLSQIEPINKMMKNATVVKQLLDATRKKEKPTTNDKSWFEIHNMENR